METGNIHRQRIVEELALETDFIGIDFFRKEARIAATDGGCGVEIEAARFIPVRKAGIYRDRRSKFIAYLTGVNQLFIAKCTGKRTRKRDSDCLRQICWRCERETAGSEQAVSQGRTARQWRSRRSANRRNTQQVAQDCRAERIGHRRLGKATVLAFIRITQTDREFQSLCHFQCIVGKDRPAFAALRIGICCPYGCSIDTAREERKRGRTGSTTK